MFVIELEKMMAGGQEQSEDKIGNRIMSLMLLTCYSSITLTQSQEVYNNLNFLHFLTKVNTK